MLTLNPVSPEFSPPHQRDCPPDAAWPTIPAINRRLVSCGLVNADNMQFTASDDTVWHHRVEREEQGMPIPRQIDGWLNLIWAPPGMDEMHSAGLGSNQRTVVIPDAKSRG